jgi:hypothetical protein
MSKTRTIQEINNEYFQTAAMMGDLIHKAAKFTGDFSYEGQVLELHQKLNSIDKEANFYQKSEERNQKAKIEKAGDAKVTPQSPAPMEAVSEQAQVQ